MTLPSPIPILVAALLMVAAAPLLATADPQALRSNEPLISPNDPQVGLQESGDTDQEGSGRPEAGDRRFEPFTPASTLQSRTSSPHSDSDRSLPLPGRRAERESRASTAWSLPDGTWRTVGALGFVITVILLFRGVLRRFAGPLAGGRAPSGVLEVLGRFPFGRGQSLVLLKLDRRVLLLCQTAQGATTLAELADADEVASLLQRVRDERGESFSAQFERLLNPVRGAAEVNSQPARQADFSPPEAQHRNPSASDDEEPVIIDLTRQPRPTARPRGLLGSGVRA